MTTYRIFIVRSFEFLDKPGTFSLRKVGGFGELNSSLIQIVVCSTLLFFSIGQAFAERGDRVLWIQLISVSSKESAEEAASQFRAEWPEAVVAKGLNDYFAVLIGPFADSERHLLQKWKVDGRIPEDSFFTLMDRFAQDLGDQPTDRAVSKTSTDTTSRIETLSHGAASRCNDSRSAKVIGSYGNWCVRQHKKSGNTWVRNCVEDHCFGIFTKGEARADLDRWIATSVKYEVFFYSIASAPNVLDEPVEIDMWTEDTIYGCQLTLSTAKGAKWYTRERNGVSGLGARMRCLEGNWESRIYLQGSNRLFVTWTREGDLRSRLEYDMSGFRDASDLMFDIVEQNLKAARIEIAKQAREDDLCYRYDRTDELMRGCLQRKIDEVYGRIIGVLH